MLQQRIITATVPGTVAQSSRSIRRGCLVSRTKNKIGWEHDEAGAVMMTRIVMRKRKVRLLLLVAVAVAAVAVKKKRCRLTM